MTNSSPSWARAPQAGPSEVTPFQFDIDLRGDAATAETTQREAEARAEGEAHAAGYAAGWAEGRRAASTASAAEVRQVRAELVARAAADRAAAEARVDQALRAMASAANRLDDRAAPCLAELEQTVVDAVFTLAEAVVGRELALATTPGADAIARALGAVPARGPVTVRLHPSDIATIADLSGTSGRLTINGRVVTVVPDPELSPGDAVAECDATTVDARIALAVNRMREAFLGEHS